MKYYNEGQFNNVLPFLRSDEVPDGLILGGPADGDEAQCFHRRWPDTKIVALEPNPEARSWQFECGNWPEGATLLDWAFSDRVALEEIVFEKGKVRNASMRGVSLEGNRDNPVVTFRWVPTTTIDEIDKRFGQFFNAIVWLDVEGFEAKALRGGANFFSKHKALLIAVEMLPEQTNLNSEVRDLLDWYGYEHVGNHTSVDFVYKRKS